MPSDKTTADRIRKVLDWAEKQRGCYISVHFDGYAEPGYSDPESGVIALGNWNRRGSYYNSDGSQREPTKDENLMPRVAHALERLGVELEWEDEWTACTNCGKLVREKPDSYSWRRSFAELDGEILCCECIEEDPSEYLESLEGDDRRCETIGVALAANGYKLLEKDFENGLHHGQDADPRKIGAALRKAGVFRYLFRLDSTGQFDMDFSVWVHDSEWEIIEENRQAYEEANKRCDISPAAACEAALKDASRKMSQLQGDGVKVAKCKADGTADVKLVSREDFIAGKALD